MDTIFTQFDQQLSGGSDKIVEIFTFAKGWENKYRQIMLLGKQLPQLNEACRQPQFLVRGCESQVWLLHQKDDQGRYHFAADSDARIVKGLLTIILSAFNGLTAEQIKSLDIQAYFGTLDLLKHLSPSRTNGIHAIVEQIRGLN